MRTKHTPPVRQCKTCLRKYRSWTKTIICCGKPVSGLTKEARKRIDALSEQIDRRQDYANPAR